MTVSQNAGTVGLNQSVKAEMRASHAGETGAVWIYRGILAANWFYPDKQIVAFADHHLQTEKLHLQAFEALIHLYRGSLLLLLWMAAGAITGFIPALLGRKWVYYTIYCVEDFVDQHYREQIELLSAHSGPQYAEVLRLMRNCREDEVDHRDEALQALANTPSSGMLLWGRWVKRGSQAAVKLARLM